MLALDQRDFPPRLGERESQRLAGLAAAEDDCIEAFGAHASPR